MSVLVRDPTNSKTYAFIKGAPERMYSNSINKPQNFDHVLETLSLGGYRTIAIGYKEVNAGEVNNYLGDNR